MPYEWRIDPERRTIVVRGFGDGEAGATLRLIAELAPALRACADFDLLYDAVDLRADSSPAAMIRVAAALFGDAGARFRRFAIVVPSARVDLGRIFAALAHPYGIEANVFGDVDAAREWLAVHPDRPHAPDAEPPTPSP